MRDPIVARRERQPLSTITLCGLILLYTLPAALPIASAVAAVCLATWWVLKGDPRPASARERASRFEVLAKSSLACVVAIAALYDLALILGPQNNVVAGLEADLARLPLLHFAERYRAGATLMQEPLPNAAGLCLSLIVLVSLATAAGLQALDTQGLVFNTARPDAEGPKARLWVLVALALSICAFNTFLALFNYATAQSYRSTIFKMNFVMGPFIWVATTQVLIIYAILLIKNVELSHHLSKAGEQ